MLTDFETLRQRGLIERIDFLALMRGEEVAISFANEDNSLSPLPFALSDVDDDRHEECSTADERSIEAACITYMELQYSYQSVASQLQFRFGVSAGDKVLICCKGRHAAEIVALLSCIKLRATFVPIDESWIGTGSRLKDIVEDAQPTAAIVACESDMDPAVLAFASAGLFRCVYLNSNGDLVQTFNILTDSNVETYGTVAAEDSNTSNSASEYERLPLYVMYTSGSSGRPKGVLGTYRGLIYRILWQLEHFPFANGEVVCRRTPLVFVDSMAEIFSALVSMTPLWCPPKERLKAGGIGGIAGEAEAAGVSRITLLPSQLHQACTLYADIGALWPSLSTVFVSGEECTFGVVDAVKQRLPNVTLVNLYGSTEVAGDVTYMTLCGPGSPAANNLRREVPNKVPIGVPIKGNYLYIVSLIAASDASSDYISSTSTAAAPSDQNIRCMILPEGEVGELLVTGEHLARGYHSIPQSTNSSSSAKFIPNPLRALLPESDPACAYDSAFLTGDLAYCRCGVYYWCGRKDRQVKIRGVRLELEEVERAVATALQVDQQSVVVLASQPALPRPSDANNAKFLALFVERSCLSKAKGMRSNSNDVKEVLSAALIPAMHPAHVVILDAFPRNTSGKIDRPALQQRLDSMFFSAAVHENASRAATLPTSTLPSTPINLTELSVQEVGLKIAEVYHKVLSLPFSAKETQPEDVIKMEFFGMGGDSVRMIEVLWELRKWTTRPVLPADLLQPIEALARQLKGETSGTSLNFFIRLFFFVIIINFYIFFKNFECIV